MRLFRDKSHYETFQESRREQREYQEKNTRSFVPVDVDDIKHWIKVLDEFPYRGFDPDYSDRNIQSIIREMEELMDEKKEDE